MSFDSLTSSTNDSAAPTSAAVPPGKRSRTDSMAPREVQRRSTTSSAAPPTATAAWAASDLAEPFALHLTPVQRAAERAAAAADVDAAVHVHTAAAHGVAGPGGPLPHAAEIQRAFGADHDISSITAHVGGAAAIAAEALGAQAFATGSHVAFAAPPDLHLAAHEAAHVIQQQSGVSLKGGVGQTGDAHEQHADAVADAVIRGESAAALLDRPAGSRSSLTPAIQRKPLDRKDENEGRGLAHLRPRQPEAPRKADDGFATLPAWAGLTVKEFTPGNLLSHVMNLGSNIKPQTLVDLARGWKERLEAGQASHSVTDGAEEAEVKAGYKNAVARSGGEYYADLTWRLAVIQLDGAGRYPTEESRIQVPGRQDDRERVQLEDGGRIVFTTAAAIDLPTGPSARRPDALRLDPTEGAGHDQGRVTCAAAGEPDDQCFLQPDERTASVAAIQRHVLAAQQNFLRACDARRAAIKAAYDADTEFTSSLVEFALGFGLSWVMKAGGKKVAGALAGRAPNPSPIQPDELATLAERQGQHTLMKTQGAKALSAAGMKALDMTEAKKLMVEALKPGLGSEDRLIAAIKQGADKAFAQVADTVADHTDAELFALEQAFRSAGQGGYEAQLGDFLAKYSGQVATIGEYDAPYAQDFEERVVWLREPATLRKRLARMRRDIPNRLDGAGPVTRLFGAVEDLSSGAKP